jgi:acetyltransferase-like isoleucine patch superfamily enzyme
MLCFGMGREMKLLNHILDLTRYFPGKMGDSLRYLGYSFLMRKLGKNTEIKDGVVILMPEKISIGNNSGINQQVYLNGFGGIDIGNYVRIAPQAALISANHNFRSLNLPISLQEEVGKKIVIEDDVWIGYGAVILKGVRVGKGSVIGANAVVSKDIPKYSIVIGKGEIVGRRN